MGWKFKYRLGSVRFLPNQTKSNFFFFIQFFYFSLPFSGVERLATSIVTLSNWLVFVQGVGASSYTGQYPPYSGENLMGVATKPVTLSKPNRVVYSPHVWGPSTLVQPYQNDPNFPANMPDIWDEHFGFLLDSNTPLILGSWGGSYVDKDKFSQDALASYLIVNGIESGIWWSLNPGQNGFGMLASDWKTASQDKLNLVERLTPSPTFFWKSGSGAICAYRESNTNPNNNNNKRKENGLSKRERIIRQFNEKMQ